MAAKSLPERGATLGGRLGAVLAILYTIFYLVSFVVWAFLRPALESELGQIIPGTTLSDWVSSIAVVAICIVPFALALGIIPGAILGAFTGWIIGKLITDRYSTSGERPAVLMGMLVALGISASCLVTAMASTVLRSFGAALEQPSMNEAERLTSFAIQIPSALAMVGTQLWFGLPLLIYIALSGWLARKLYREYTHRTAL